MRTLPLTQNPLLTRADVQRLVCDLVEPLIPHFSPGCAQLNIGANRAAYGDPASQLEAFTRALWGLVPLAAGGGAFGHWEHWRRGIAAGTDPEHPEFWGWPGDYDQRCVEAAALGCGLALAPEELWTPLDAAVRARLAAWLGRINRVKLVRSNWLFFRVLVNLGLQRVGAAAELDIVDSDLDAIDRFHLGDGWYADGPGGAQFRTGRTGDYYVAMAFHYYGLVYSRVAEALAPARSERFLARARRFAPDFAHYFAADGPALPFGRSLTYRFAQGAFWGALAYAGAEALPWPVVKGLYLRHLRWWLRQPIFSETGLLSIGYAYPNLAMAEGYNAAGSPYWALKAFLPLALAPAHPFWQADEAPLPMRRSVHTVAGAKLVLTTDPRSRDVTALSAGQPVDDSPRHAAQKYSKFAYSTRFGFAVPVGAATPAEGGFDSMLALSDDQRRYRGREHCHDAAVRDGVAYSRWRPWPDVEVHTWLLAAGTCHVRVHRLTSARALWSAECGFAVPYLRSFTPRRGSLPGAAELVTPFGHSRLRDLGGGRQGTCVALGANSHLLQSLAAMPVLRAAHAPGSHWLVCVAAGSATPAADAAADGFAATLTPAAVDITLDGAHWWRSAGHVTGESSPARLQSLRAPA